MQTNLQTKVINPQYNGSQIYTENIQSKITSIWQEKNMETTNKYQYSEKIDLSPIEKDKINKFIDELKSKEDDKIFFSYVFKTMIKLDKNQKKILISGVNQILQASGSPELASLNKRFNRSANHYMSISLMNTPFINQFNYNMNNINLEGNEDEELVI
ncbi:MULTISPECIES: hypothetical protein [unclassified Providencia]|uniref:hypothetical protein n=1 Tax=unclassified Providencia TaxID=2633465 RepID=UPI00234BD29E|nr:MULTISPECIES: hypothetical protein [unclassified Providencia]